MQFPNVIELRQKIKFYNLSRQLTNVKIFIFNFFKDDLASVNQK